MRKILLTLFVALPFFSIAQKDSAFEFKFIDSISGSKNELFTKSSIWVTNVFKSAKDVIQMSDKDAGRIVAKGLFNYPFEGTWGTTLYDYVNFKVTIDVKDNKYRIVLSDFSHEKGSYRDAVSGGPLELEKPSCGTFFMSKKRWLAIKEYSKKTAQDMIKQYSSVMNKPLPKDEF